MEKQPSIEQKKITPDEIKQAQATAKSIVAKILGEAKYREQTTDELNQLEEEHDSSQGSSKERVKGEKNDQTETSYNLNLQEEKRQGNQKDRFNVFKHMKNMGQDMRMSFRAQQEEYDDGKNELVLEAIAPSIAVELDTYIEQLLTKSESSTGNQWNEKGVIITTESETNDLETFVDTLDEQLESAGVSGGLSRVQRLQLRQALNVVLDVKRVVKADAKKNTFEQQKSIGNTDTQQYLENLDKLNTEITAEDYKKIAEDTSFELKNKGVKALVTTVSRGMTIVGTGLGAVAGGMVAGSVGAVAESYFKTKSVEKKSAAIMERDKNRLLEKSYADILLDRDLEAMQNTITNGKKFEFVPKQTEGESEKSTEKWLEKWLERLNNNAEVKSSAELVSLRDQLKETMRKEAQAKNTKFSTEEFQKKWKEEAQKYVPLETIENLYRTGKITIDGAQYDSSTESIENNQDSIIAQSKKALNDFKAFYNKKLVRANPNDDGVHQYNKADSYDLVTMSAMSKQEAYTRLKENYDQLLGVKELLQDTQIAALGNSEQVFSKKNSFKDVRMIRMLEDQIQRYQVILLKEDQISDSAEDIKSSRDSNTPEKIDTERDSNISEKLRRMEDEKINETRKYEKILDFKKNEKVLTGANRWKTRSWFGALGLAGNAAALFGSADLVTGDSLNTVAQELGAEEVVKSNAENLALSEHIQDKVSGVFETEVKNIVDNSLDRSNKIWEEAFKQTGENKWLSAWPEGAASVENRVVNFTQKIGVKGLDKSIQDILQDKASELMIRGGLLVGSSFIVPSMVEKLGVKKSAFEKKESPTEYSNQPEHKNPSANLGSGDQPEPTKKSAGKNETKTQNSKSSSANLWKDDLDDIKKAMLSSDEGSKDGENLNEEGENPSEKNTKEVDEIIREFNFNVNRAKVNIDEKKIREEFVNAHKDTSDSQLKNLVYQSKAQIIKYRVSSKELNPNQGREQIQSILEELQSDSDLSGKTKSEIQDKCDKVIELIDRSQQAQQNNENKEGVPTDESAESNVSSSSEQKKREQEVEKWMRKAEDKLEQHKFKVSHGFFKRIIDTYSKFSYDQLSNTEKIYFVRAIFGRAIQDNKEGFDLNELNEQSSKIIEILNSIDKDTEHQPEIDEIRAYINEWVQGDTTEQEKTVGIEESTELGSSESKTESLSDMIAKELENLGIPREQGTHFNGDRNSSLANKVTKVNPNISNKLGLNSTEATSKRTSFQEIQRLTQKEQEELSDSPQDNYKVEEASSVELKNPQNEKKQILEKVKYLVDAFQKDYDKIVGDIREYIQDNRGKSDFADQLEVYQYVDTLQELKVYNNRSLFNEVDRLVLDSEVLNSLTIENFAEVENQLKDLVENTQILNYFERVIQGNYEYIDDFIKELRLYIKRINQIKGFLDDIQK